MQLYSSQWALFLRAINVHQMTKKIVLVLVIKLVIKTANAVAMKEKNVLVLTNAIANATKNATKIVTVIATKQLNANAAKTANAERTENATAAKIAIVTKELKEQENK